MKAWLVEQHSDAYDMRLADVETPSPEPGRSLLRVEAVALNFSDLLMMRGAFHVEAPLPFTPGREVAGTIADPAPGSRFQAGDRVACLIPFGGFAEHTLIEDAQAIALPASVPAADAATFPISTMTAHMALHHFGRLQAGESVLIHAAAGGVGLAAVQIAKAAGARVVAVAGGEARIAAARSAGADTVIDHRTEDWPQAVKQDGEGRGVNVVLDTMGGDVTAASQRCLRFGGRHLIIGFSLGAPGAVDLGALLGRGTQVIGVHWRHGPDAEAIDAAVADILALHASGALRPVLDRSFAFDAIPDAITAMAERRLIGKAVFEVSADG